MSSQINPFDVFRYPLFTEKWSYNEEGSPKYAFVIDPRATKKDIKLAAEKVFELTPTKVNILNYKAQNRRFRNVAGKEASSKKAILTFPEGTSIKMFEEVFE